MARWLLNPTVDLWSSPPDMISTEAFRIDLDANVGTMAAYLTGAGSSPCQLRVDFSERHALLLDLARKCDDFDVQMTHLAAGDYVIAGGRRR